MNKKVFIIYPSTGSTNFEVSRLNYFLNIKDKQIDFFPIDIKVKNIFQDYTQYAYNSIISKVSSNYSNEAILIFIKSSLILVDQFKLINNLQRVFYSIKTILSLGDEYRLSVDEVEVNKFLYDQIFVYNKTIFKNLDNTSNKFVYCPMLGMINKIKKSKKNNFKENKYIFIGKAYSARVEILKKIIKKNKNLKFLIAGQGWKKSIKNQNNVEIFDWVNNDKYSELLLNSKYCLILDVDEVGTLHVTSKLPDALSHGCIPVFLDFDPRIKKLNNSLIYKIDTNSNIGNIVAPESNLVNRNLFALIDERFSNYDDLNLFKKNLLDLIELNHNNQEQKELYISLYKLGILDLIFNKNKFSKIKYKGKNVCFSFRIFGIRLPRKFSNLILNFPRRLKKSNKYLFIESSGIEIASRINFLPNPFFNLILKKVFKWV